MPWRLKSPPFERGAGPFHSRLPRTMAGVSRLPIVPQSPVHWDAVLAVDSDRRTLEKRSPARCNQRESIGRTRAVREAPWRLRGGLLGVMPSDSHDGGHCCNWGGSTGRASGPRQAQAHGVAESWPKSREGFRGRGHGYAALGLARSFSCVLDPSSAVYVAAS